MNLSKIIYITAGESKLFLKQKALNVIHILLHDTIIVNDVTWINLSVNYHSHERYIKFFYFPFHSLVHLCFMSILR